MACLKESRLYFKRDIVAELVRVLGAGRCEIKSKNGGIFNAS